MSEFLERAAEEGSRALSRWYGRIAFAYPKAGERMPSCKDWLLEHWRQHPTTSPTRMEGGS